MKNFLQGLTMGLAYVAPIGLQNLFVINTSLTQKKRVALFTAIAVIFFDISLAFACFFGIGAILERIPVLQLIILLAGSLVVMAIGISLLRTKQELTLDRNMKIPIPKIISTACIVTWANPQAVIDGTMMLGAFRVTMPGNAGLGFIGGVAAASFLWFTGLSLFISLFSSKFTSGVLKSINRICGIVIIFYGGKLLYSFIMKII